MVRFQVPLPLKNTILIILLIIEPYTSANKINLLNRRNFLELDRNFDFDSKSLKNDTLQHTMGESSQLKYILRWTTGNHEPFLFPGVGQQNFIHGDCLYTNCFETANKNLLGDYTNFDAIVFSGSDLRQFSKSPSLLPQRRSELQKYVFASTDCGDNDAYLEDYDDYFNWTWTYRLDSDIRWGFIAVTDINDNVVGPNMTMHWIKREDMLPVKDDIKDILRHKNKAVVTCLFSNSSSISGREKYAKELKNILNSKYNLDLTMDCDCSIESNDVYGNDCDANKKNKYHFYLAYEQSICKDYVTEDILRAFQFNAVPIVYGGANYSRFLPEGSYLNAGLLSTEHLAKKINEMMNDFHQYVQYFKWTNHYKYYCTLDLPKTNEYCTLCELLNDERKMKEHSLKYRSFRIWWRGKEKAEKPIFYRKRKPNSILDKFLDIVKVGKDKVYLSFNDVIRFFAFHKSIPGIKSFFG